MKVGLILLVGLAACDAGVPNQTPASPAHVEQTVHNPPVITPPAPKPHPHEVLATLRRTACYGRCPIYVVTVYRDGVVEFVGEEYVKKKGQATGHITLVMVDAIESLFVDNHYTSLLDAYDKEDVTDNPSAETSYRSLDGPVKHVRHYYGDSDAPAVLFTIEDKLDALVGTDRWVGKL